MFHKDHRHNPNAPLSIILGRLALKIAGHVIKKKIAGRLAARSAEREQERQRRSDESDRGHRYGAA